MSGCNSFILYKYRSKLPYENKYEITEYHEPWQVCATNISRPRVLSST